MNKIVPREPEDYAELLIQVKDRVRSAQYEALSVVSEKLALMVREILWFHNLVSINLLEISSVMR